MRSARSGGPRARARRPRGPQSSRERRRALSAASSGQELRLACGRPAGARLARRLAASAPQQLVDRRRHAVQAPEQHDLAVEVVGLDRAARRARGSATTSRRRARARRTGLIVIRRAWRSSYSVVADVVDPGRRERGDAPRRGAPRDLGPAGVGLEQRVDGVARRCAGASRTSSARCRPRGCEAKPAARRTRRRSRAPARRRRAGWRPMSSEPGDRRGVRDDDARLEMRRRQLHARPSRCGEPPQRRALVLDAVLHAGDRDRRRPAAASRRSSAPAGVLALDGQQHDVVAAPGDLAGAADDRRCGARARRRATRGAARRARSPRDGRRARSARPRGRARAARLPITPPTAPAP